MTCQQSDATTIAKTDATRVAAELLVASTLTSAVVDEASPPVTVSVLEPAVDDPPPTLLAADDAAVAVLSSLVLEPPLPLVDALGVTPGVSLGVTKGGGVI